MIEGVGGRIDDPLVVFAGENPVGIAVGELTRRHQVLVGQAPVPVEPSDASSRFQAAIVFDLDDLPDLGLQPRHQRRRERAGRELVDLLGT